MIDSLDFLNFSKKVLKLEQLTEVDYRQVVSRSYYCAFHQVRDKAELLGVPVNAYGGGTHSSLSQTLKEIKPTHPEFKRIGFQLNNFHAQRVLADYKLNQNMTEKSANEAIAMCEKILASLNDITSL